jgi:hypothetical protein
MALELPGDIEPFMQDHHAFERIHGPAVYALRLSKPDDLEATWDDHFDERPGYFAELDDATRVIYVGGARNLLRRLTDHKDGEKRLTVLTDLCDIEALRNVEWVDDPDRVEIEERRFALLLANHLPDTYVHQR